MKCLLGCESFPDLDSKCAGCREKVRDYPISELRIVKLRFKGGPLGSAYTADHMMHVSQVETFVQASVDLHHKQLPHKDGKPRKAAPLWEVRVSKLNLDTKSYWWCCPGLKDNDHPEGARLNDTYLSERVWAHPTLLEDERRAEEYED